MYYAILYYELEHPRVFFPICREPWNQSLADTKGQVYKNQMLFYIAVMNN